MKTKTLILFLFSKYLKGLTLMSSKHICLKNIYKKKSEILGFICFKQKIKIIIHFTHQQFILELHDL